MDYIERIKKLKSEKRITNDKLSEMTGIPLGTLSKILAGMNDSPKLANIIAISEALGCTIDYLVSGTPQNNNNFSLSDSEISFVKKFRELDACGKDIATFVVEREYSRISEQTDMSQGASVTHQNKNFASAKIIDKREVFRVMEEVASHRAIPLFDMPVSAGGGVYLDDDASAEKIKIPNNKVTSSADFALRIYGQSMEPRYHDGDVVLVERCEGVAIGELGIFVLDGQGYFKQNGGDRLISLNPEFTDILLKDYSQVSCCGKVVGRVKRK